MEVCGGGGRTCEQLKVEIKKVKKKSHMDKDQGTDKERRGEERRKTEELPHQPKYQPMT